MTAPHSTLNRVFGAVLLAVAGLLIPAVAALADAGRPEGRGGCVGLQAGYLKASDATTGNYLAGAHLEVQLTGLVGLHGDVSWRTYEQYRFRAQARDLSMDVRVIPLTVSARVYAPVPIGLRPYALGGAGWYAMDYRFSDDAKELLGVADATETSFGWHVGAGVAMTVAPRIGLFAEYRAIFTDPDRELGAQVREAIRNLDFDSSNAIAGISLYF